MNVEKKMEHGAQGDTVLQIAGIAVAWGLLLFLVRLAPAQEPEAPPKQQPPAAPAKQEPEAAKAEKKVPSAEELAADLKSGAGEKRMEALRTISSEQIKEKGLLQPLLDVVGDNSEANKEARPLAVRALVGLKEADLTPVEKDSLLRALIDGIKDKAREVQMAAIVGIGGADTMAEPALLAVAGGEDAPVRILAFQRLAMIWAVRPPERRKEAPPAPAELLKALEDKNDHVRTIAAMAFWAGGFKDKAAIPVLLKMFSDKAEGNAQGRAHALHALAALRSAALTAEEQKQILDAIQEGLKDAAPDVRYYAAWGIRRGDKALLPALEAIVKDADPRVRAIAHEKLYQLRGFAFPVGADLTKAPAELLTGLSDPDAAVRAQAVRAFWLGGYKDAAALNLLLNVFRDKSDENRLARLDVIRALGNLRTAALGDEDKKSITEAIISGLKDPSFSVRYQSARAITASDSAALPALKEAEKDENPLVQSAVKEALQRLGK
jgi:HEAT repeat protein